MNESVAAAVNQALARNEVEAERLANRVRLLFLCGVAALALFNAPSVSKESNQYNFAALGTAFLYGGAVFAYLKTRGYRPALKYITSFADVTIVHILLLLYTLESVATVALKNPVFYVVYPLIALTLFRCHPRLTALTGWYTVTLYCGLYACVASRVGPVWGDYATELFEARVTVVGQLTKILILIVYVVVVSYLAVYGRALLHGLVRDEVAARNEKETMERELELASQVQAQLLPGEYPQVAGLKLHGTIIEGRFVGGDYYDFIRLSAHSVLLLVGDVSGKGVPAALIMSGVRASVRLSASTNASLEELVLRLNEMLYESTHATSYLTLFAAEIDVAAGSVRYVNAGHPPPLLHAADGIHALASGTVPLGLFPALPGLRAHCEPFPPGSLLVACTDGVSERSNPAGEFYGLGSLQRFVERNRHLDCPDFAGALLNEVRQFGANTPLEDDLTLAVARFDAVQAHGASGRMAGHSEIGGRARNVAFHPTTAGLWTPAVHFTANAVTSRNRPILCGFRSGLTSHPCHRTLRGVIRSFRHRGLRRLWEGDPGRIGAALRDRIENVLAVLDAAATTADLDLPGYRLHALKGDLKGLWSVTVSGNWRITFRVEHGNVFDVDLTDYH